MENIAIREIIEQVESGQIRIPAFQRGFVWEPERVAQFIDSLYKGYPFGAFLFWRTNERLRSERNLGPFELPPPRIDFPIDYVLDGQQRITSVYATFQTSRSGTAPDWKDIYFDFSLPTDAQEPQFFALSDSEVDATRHFPLRVIYDTTQYRRSTRQLEEELAIKIDNMQTRFKEAKLPLQAFRTDDKGTVAIIFERINRQGVALDTLQLLSAWTWSEEFQLQSQFADLIDEVESRGFIIDEFDENLFLRCASAVLVGNPRPESIVTINGEQIRNRFDEVKNGILGAIDFLDINFGIKRIDNLPYQTLLVPLSVFFSIAGTQQIVLSSYQRDSLIRWFWRTSFERRYSSGTLRVLEDDIRKMSRLKSADNNSDWEDFTSFSPEFFMYEDFSTRNVSTKSFILMLASCRPLSFISGMPLDLRTKMKEYNNTEFHHIVPKAFVRSTSNSNLVNCLANRCFLSRSENRELGGEAPSTYRAKMPSNLSDILLSALCPASLFNDDFDVFLADRSSLLASRAAELMNHGLVIF